MDTADETSGNDVPHATVNARLRAIAEAQPVAPPWVEAWARLGPGSPEEDWLAVYQSIRHCGHLPDHASFWLVVQVVDAIAFRDADEVLGEYESRMRAIEEEFGFDEIAIWPANAAPAEYVQILGC